MIKCLNTWKSSLLSISWAFLIKAMVEVRCSDLFSFTLNIIVVMMQYNMLKHQPVMLEVKIKIGLIYKSRILSGIKNKCCDSSF